MTNNIIKMCSILSVLVLLCGCAQEPVVTSQYTAPQFGETSIEANAARPLVYEYPPRAYPGNYRPAPAPVNGCQRLYTVSPYAPTGYACLGPNGTWYVNE